jgi:hypothetical protein
MCDPGTKENISTIKKGAKKEQHGQVGVALYKLQV